MGGNSRGFQTQRAALEGEDQLRWVGGFPSHTSLLRLLCNPLVQVVRVNLFAVCMCDGALRCWSVVRFDLVVRFVLRVVVFHKQTAFGSGERVNFYWRAEGGRNVEVAVRAARD